MTRWNRVLKTLLAATAAGFLLWLAAQFNMNNTGGYWAALGVVAGAGLLLGFAQLRGSGGSPRAMLLLAFLPVAICAAWIVAYAEPHGNWFRDHVSRWSGDIGIGGVVRDIATWNGVIAFAAGLVLAYVLEPRMLLLRWREAAPAAPAMEPAAADEPTMAEREEAAATTDTRTAERTTTTVS